MSETESTRTHCPSCGTDNRGGRRFCAQCGTALPVPCANCGFVNEPNARFCGGCGSTLAAGGSAAPARFAGGSLEGERRPVAVLFADLSGFTGITQNEDPEEVHRLLERFFEIVDDIVTDCGGIVDKHIGDNVMAIFGAPLAHGDDALRAVRAAVEIQAAMPAISEELGRKLAVHIGIAAGEVVASGVGSAQHRAYTVIGHSVNLAARLLALARGGETVLDDVLHTAIRRHARCAPLEGLVAKGIEGPLAAWRLIELVESGLDTAAQPFVGRVAELAQLAASLESCGRSGAGGTIHVRGEPGIGKSRLAGELRRAAAAEGFVCHTALVLDFGVTKGRDAIRELVAAMLGLGPGAGAAERAAIYEFAIAGDAALAAERMFLADLLDLPPPEDTRTLYAAMEESRRGRGRAAAAVRVLAAACGNSPVLLVVEDVHWADRSTLDCIAVLARAAAALPAVLALTSRRDDDPLDASWRASLDGSPLVTIDLGPLAARDSLALADHLRAGSREMQERCVERAAGNPLYLEQLLRNADENDERLPASVQSLVLARLDRLPERDRAVLRAAAVVGQRFPPSLARRLADLPEYGFDRLIQQNLIRQDADEYLFAHALIRDGIYASITKSRRAELHRAAALWYRERDPTLCAQHLDRADSPDAPKAYLAAARAQAAAQHLEPALALARRGAALAHDAADAHALEMLRGELHCRIGEGAPAVDAYRAALAAAPSAADRCRALLGIAAGQRLIAGIDAALAALAEAEPIARLQHLVRERAELHHTRGNLHFARGDVAACRAEHEEALACAHALGDPEWEARALSGLADADYAAGRMASACSRFRRCVELCDAHGLARVAIPNRAMVGHCRLYLTEFDGSLADTEAALALALAVGDRHGEMFALESQGLMLTFCGRHVEALPALERALALAQSLRARRYEAVLQVASVEILLARGERAAAIERLEHAHALALETGMRFCGAIVLALRMATAGDPEERERWREEGRALLDQGCVGHSPIAFHRIAIDDALALGERERALEHVAALAAYTAAEPLPYTEFLIARGRTLAGLLATPDDRALKREIGNLRARAAALGWRIAFAGAAES